ncbi:hypothetical protein B0H16DRAFT_1716127 [Mycena metata]|uniref:Uncharacterized protein n=1 Tax=Mycena metata TaxID=1033252 RepID=A0AAD7NNJ6_9AGAR|nr:hypothetical protein B0H16DRAFT_1716127 [Mycena metata]
MLANAKTHRETRNPFSSIIPQERPPPPSDPTASILGCYVLLIPAALCVYGAEMVMLGDAGWARWLCTDNFIVVCHAPPQIFSNRDLSFDSLSAAWRAPPHLQRGQHRGELQSCDAGERVLATTECDAEAYATAHDNPSGSRIYPVWLDELTNLYQIRCLSGTPYAANLPARSDLSLSSAADPEVALGSVTAVVFVWHCGLLLMHGDTSSPGISRSWFAHGVLALAACTCIADRPLLGRRGVRPRTAWRPSSTHRRPIIPPPPNRRYAAREWAGLSQWATACFGEDYVSLPRMSTLFEAQN